MKKYEISDNLCFYRKCHPETCICPDDELVVIQNILNEHGAFKYSKIIKSVYSVEGGKEFISLCKENDLLKEKVVGLESRVKLNEVKNGK